MGEDDHEADAKTRTLKNSASELMNPLEMVKKTLQAFESISSDAELGFMPKLRFWAKMRTKPTQKIGL